MFCDPLRDTSVIKSGMLSLPVNTEARTRWLPIWQTTLQIQIRQRKYFTFDKGYTEVCFIGSNKQYYSIGSCNGLVPTRGQAIIWSNDGIVYWRVYALLGLNELKSSSINRVVCNFVWYQEMPCLVCNWPKQTHLWNESHSIDWI